MWCITSTIEIDPLLLYMYMENIPLYRTRRFWVVIYSLMLAWSVFFYYLTFWGATDSILDFIAYGVATLGAVIISVVAGIYFTSEAYAVVEIVYAVFFAYLIYKTFDSDIVKLRYPTLVVLLICLATYLNYLIVSSYG